MEKCVKHFAIVGRVFMGGLFLLSGIQKVMTFEGTAQYIASVGLPASTLVAVLVILLEIGAGAALIAGKQVHHAALGLAAFTMIAAVVFHGIGSWEDNPMQKAMFMKNIAIAGGLLFMAAHTSATCLCKKETKVEKEAPAESQQTE